MMDRRTAIRNLSVIAHVDHGKSTLTDSLLAKAGIKGGKERWMDGREDEAKRGITIKSTGVSMFFERSLTKSELCTSLSLCFKEHQLESEQGFSAVVSLVHKFLGKENKIPYLINLIDSPGHVDFSSEVTAALRVTDGALVVVDCISGAAVQTETVLCQALSEKIKPVLFVNKLDRIFLEKKTNDLEGIYQNLRKIIEQVNCIIQSYDDGSLGDLTVTPLNGKVGFGSGLQAWGFTLLDFAKLVASGMFTMDPEQPFKIRKKQKLKYKQDLGKLMKKLWGNWCWHPVKEKWVKHDPRTGLYTNSGKETPIKLERGFCQFVLKPLKVMFDLLKEEDIKTVQAICPGLGVRLTKEEWEQPIKSLTGLVFSRWISCGDALLDMIVNHLPSPAEAQRYRCEVLYTGDLNDPICDSIRNCDPDGEMSMFVSKMVPLDEKSGRFVAFGRVFSGTVRPGQQVRLYTPNYVPGSSKGLFKAKIVGTCLMMGSERESLPSCPCGSMVGLVGIDKYLKSGTITTDPGAAPFKCLKFSVSAVVQKAVEPKKMSDIAKFRKGLEFIEKTDPLLQVRHNEDTGEWILAGAGELHLQIVLSDLRAYLGSIAVIEKEPVVSYCEGISGETGDFKRLTGNTNYPEVCVAKSKNKHNRLYASAEPLGEKLINALEDSTVNERQDVKERNRSLVKDFGWDKHSAGRIWSLGMEPDAKANVLVNFTSGVSYMNEVKAHVSAGFHQATSRGVICREPVRGMRVNVHDAKLHSDAIHRGPGQIVPCIEKAIRACQIASGPKLMEPVFRCEIDVPKENVQGVFDAVNSRRGETFDICYNEEDKYSLRQKLNAYLPVAESFGFTALLRGKTAGKAFLQMSFDHWQDVKGNPLEEGTPANRIAMDIRKRKGLPSELPKFEDYYDRI